MTRKKDNKKLYFEKGLLIFLIVGFLYLTSIYVLDVLKCPDPVSYEQDLLNMISGYPVTQTIYAPDYDKAQKLMNEYYVKLEDAKAILNTYKNLFVKNKVYEDYKNQLNILNNNFNSPGGYKDIFKQEYGRYPEITSKPDYYSFNINHSYNINKKCVYQNNYKYCPEICWKTNHLLISKDDLKTLFPSPISNNTTPTNNNNTTKPINNTSNVVGNNKSKVNILVLVLLSFIFLFLLFIFLYMFVFVMKRIKK